MSAEPTPAIVASQNASASARPMSAMKPTDAPLRTASMSRSARPPICRKASPSENSATRTISVPEHLLLRYRRIGIQAIDERDAGGEFQPSHRLGAELVEDHDEGAERIAVRGDEHAPAAHHVRQDARHVIGPDPRARVAQALAAR